MTQHPDHAWFQQALDHALTLQAENPEQGVEIPVEQLVAVLKAYAWASAQMHEFEIALELRQHKSDLDKHTDRIAANTGSLLERKDPCFRYLSSEKTNADS